MSMAPIRAVLGVSDATWERDGLFLIGFGALLVVVGLVVWGAPGGLTGRPVGPTAPARERWVWTANVVGAAAVALGSVAVVVGNWPPTVFVAVTAAVALASGGGLYWYSGRRGDAHRAGGPPDAKRSSRKWLIGIISAALLFGVAVIVVEEASQGVRDWLVDRPALVGLVSAFLVVTPAIFVIEHWIASAQAKRWRKTAVNGVETFVWHATRFHDRALPLALPAVEPYKAADEHLDYEGVLERLGEKKPEFFMDKFSPVARDEANRSGALILTAAPAMALYPDLSDYIDRLWDIQNMMLQVDDRCYGIGFLTNYIGSPKEQRARASISRLAREIAGLHFQIQRQLADLKLDISDIGAIGSSAIAAAHDELQADDGDG